MAKVTVDGVFTVISIGYTLIDHVGVATGAVMITCAVAVIIGLVAIVVSVAVYVPAAATKLTKLAVVVNT